MEEDRVKTNILITGAPGVGKTTVIGRILEAAESLHPVGFYTEEIREGGARTGFSLVSTAGKRAVLAHEKIQGRFAVGKYGVDVAGFERFLAAVPFRDGEPECPVVIDEIGRMECFSKIFTDLVAELLSSDRTVIATVALKGDGLIESVKKRPDCDVIEVTRENRDSLPRDILERVLARYW